MTGVGRIRGPEGWYRKNLGGGGKAKPLSGIKKCPKGAAAGRRNTGVDALYLGFISYIVKENLRLLVAGVIDSHLHSRIVGYYCDNDF